MRARCRPGPFRAFTFFSMAVVCASCQKTPTSVPATEPEAERDDAQVRQIVERFLAPGADVNSRELDGNTPLTVAADRGFEDLVDRLIRLGADVNRGGECNVTPLYAASSGGHKRIVERLIAAGASVNAATVSGLTPLEMAADNGHLEIVKLLISKGAAVNSVDGVGHGPLYSAVSESHADVVRLLLESRADVNVKDSFYGIAPLLEATRNRNLEIMSLLLSHGADPNTATKDGETPLISACSSIEFEEGTKAAMVRKLIEHGADVRARTRSSADSREESEIEQWEPQGRLCTVGGKSALHAAAFCLDSQVMQILLERGADVNLATDRGETALHVACRVDALGGQEDKLPVVELLIKHGADVNARTRSGETALERVLSKKENRIAEVLRRHGAEQQDKVAKEPTPPGHR